MAIHILEFLSCGVGAEHQYLLDQRFHLNVVPLRSDDHARMGGRRQHRRNELFDSSCLRHEPRQYAGAGLLLQRQHHLRVTAGRRTIRLLRCESRAATGAIGTTRRLPVAHCAIQADLARTRDARSFAKIPGIGRRRPSTRTIGARLARNTAAWWGNRPPGRRSKGGRHPGRCRLSGGGTKDHGHSNCRPPGRFPRGISAGRQRYAGSRWPAASRRG